VCCKFCCVVNGGCAVKGHQPGALSQTQLTKLATVKRTSTSNPLPPLPSTQPQYAPPRFSLDPRLAQPERSFDDLAKLLSDSNPVLHLQREEEANSRKQQEEAEQEAELERLEDEDYRRAVADSLSLIPMPSSSSPPAFSGVSSLRPLPTVSESSTSLLVHGLPVTRVNGSNRPTITSQMSDDWMRAHEDRTKLPQAIRKGQIDSELLKRFRVVWWSKVCMCHLGLNIYNSHNRQVPRR